MNLRNNRRLNPRAGTVIFGSLFVGILAAALFLYGWSHFAMTKMQRQCFSLYVQASFPLGKTVSRNAVHHALGENVNPRDKSRVAKAPIYRTLHDLTYGGKSLPEVVALPTQITGSILLLSLIVGAVRANRKRRELENGIPLRGPKLMTFRQFNRSVRGPIGMKLQLYRPRTPDWLISLLKLRPHAVSMPEMTMSQHFLFVGDTGVGKTLLNTQVICQAQRLGYTCVINDPKNKYIQQFYRPERGDIILNPKDMRCPYWLLSAEFSDESEALTLGRSMFPAHPNNPQAEFWDNFARNFLAYLLASSKTPLDCASLAEILISEEQLARRAVGSSYGQLFDVDGGGSSNMRTSVIQTMNQIGHALRMMPRREDTLRTFSIREWSKHRKGWIFLSRTEDTKEAVVPLQSAWFDMIMSALLTFEGQATMDSATPLVLVSLDELKSLNQLPKLESAVTMLRESGNIISMGIQNTAQVDDTYGKQAETIISMCGTKWIGRTSHKKTAEDLSGTIGEIEVRQVNQTRTSGMFGGRERDSYSGPTEIRKPLVMPSEIQGLPNRQGYLLQAPTGDEVGLHVVHAKIPYYPAVKRQPGLIPRIIKRPEDPSAAINVTPQPEAAPPPQQGTLVRLS